MKQVTAYVGIDAHKKDLFIAIRSDLFELRRTLMDSWANFATAKRAKILPIRA